MKWFNVICLAAFVLTACTPSGSAIQTAIVETQRALPPSTATVIDQTAIPTNTPIPEQTAINSPTETMMTSALPAQITDSQGVSMALIPAGKFTMGYPADLAYGFCETISTHVTWYGYPCEKNAYLREEPVHKVNLGSFYMDVFEVTNQEYEKCVSAGACLPPSLSSANRFSSYYNNADFLSYPVLNVTWEMAANYCEWRGARLPTEAEWEKAARGIDERTFPWGAFNFVYDVYKLEFYTDRANINLDFGANKATVPVSSNPKGLSPYGLFNMAGNVAEWVADWYNEIYYSESPSEQPLGPATGEYKVVRGGSVNNFEIRTTARDYRGPTEFDSGIGMRCARDATP